MKIHSIALAAFLVLFFVPVPPAWAGAEPQTWRVAFDHQQTEFQRALLGTLTLDAEGVLSFSADNRLVQWTVAPADVKRIARSDGYGAASNALVLETASGERLYIAVLDRNLLYTSPRKVLRAIEAALAPGGDGGAARLTNVPKR